MPNWLFPDVTIMLEPSTCGVYYCRCEEGLYIPNGTLFPIQSFPFYRGFGIDLAFKAGSLLASGA